MGFSKNNRKPEKNVPSLFAGIVGSAGKTTKKGGFSYLKQIRGNLSNAPWRICAQILSSFAR